MPAQWPSTRRLEAGDALTCEISAAWWDHPGQLLRTFAVAAEPTPLYRELHAAADAAFDASLAVLRPGATAADVVAAAGVIEDAGFTTRDDLLHGFVGGYLPPVVGSPSRQIAPVPDFTFAAGMTVVDAAERRDARRARRRADRRARAGRRGRAPSACTASSAGCCAPG